MPPDDESRLARARRLAHWLDDGLRIPGTSIRVGADPLFGLVPIIGDLLGAGLGAIIVLHAVRLRVPLATLLRMMLNLLLDELIGSIPVAGDLYDVAAKVNLRNVALLERALDSPARAGRADGWYLLGILALLAGLLVGLLVVSILVVRWLFAILVR